MTEEVFAERLAHVLSTAHDRGFAAGVTAGVESLARAFEEVMRMDASLGSTALSHDVVKTVLAAVRAEAGPRG